MATSTIKVNEYVGKSYTNNLLITFANMKINSGKKLIISVSNTFRALMFCCTMDPSGGNGLYSVWCNSSGSGGYASLEAATNITVSGGTRQIIVTNNTPYITGITLMIQTGSVTGVEETNPT